MVECVDGRVGGWMVGWLDGLTNEVEKERERNRDKGMGGGGGSVSSLSTSRSNKVNFRLACTRKVYSKQSEQTRKQKFRLRMQRYCLQRAWAFACACLRLWSE